MFTILAAGLLAAAGCQTRSSHDFCYVDDVVCDRNSVSVVVHSERSVNADENYFAHGYLISRRNDFWVATWSLQRESAIDDPLVVYLGKYEEQREDGGGRITREEGVLGGFLATAQPGVAVTRHKRLRVFDRGVERKSTETVQPELGVRGADYSFTRSRSHLFAWSPEPAIYSIPDSQVVRSLGRTLAFQEFEKFFWWRENVRAFLTEDLAYLIAVPHNGASDSSRGGEHTKAFCYAIDRDEVSTVSLKGIGAALIWDAEPTDEGIQWLVLRDGHERRWSILDSDSRIISEFVLPPGPEFYTEREFWDPTRDLIWSVRMPMSTTFESVTQNISVVKFKISDGSYVEMELPAANLVVPE